MSKQELSQADFLPGKPLRVFREDGKFSDFSTDALVGNSLNSFVGWTCGAGTENLFIDPDGFVYGASCRINGKYGNVFADFKAPDEWITCTKARCTCGSDLFIPKVRQIESKSVLSSAQSNHPSNRIPHDDSSPFKAMKRVHQSDVKQVYWEISRRCNYSCSYCWPGLHNTTDPSRNFEELSLALKKIESHFIKSERAHFIFSGGEPTLHQGLLPFIKSLKEKHHSISMHSNGSKRPDLYKELILLTNLNLSAHFEFMKPEHFIEVIKGAAEVKRARDNRNVGHLEVKIMLKPGMRKEALNLEEQIIALPGFKGYCTLAFVPIRDSSKGDVVMDGYDSEDFALFGERSYS